MDGRGASRAAGRSAMLIALFVGALAPAAQAAKRSAETDSRLGPADGAGHFFTAPAPTGVWHGCRASDDQWWPVSVIDGLPTDSPSTDVRVTFTVHRSSPQFTWRVRRGFRICGVQVLAQMSSPEVPGYDLLSEIVYPSGRVSGSTARSGPETLKVRVPASGISSDYDDFAGKTMSIVAFQAITVFVRLR